MGSAGLAPFTGTTQFSGEDIIDMADKVTGRLPERSPKTAYIVLTERDINSKERALRFLFAMQDRSIRTGVVSTAQLTWRPQGGRADMGTIRTRLRTMVKRGIGELYYGYPRSVEIRDVMYSPLMRVEDVDKVGSDFLHKTGPSR